MGVVKSWRMVDFAFLDDSRSTGLAGSTSPPLNAHNSCYWLEVRSNCSFKVDRGHNLSFSLLAMRRLFLIGGLCNERIRN